jgi:hypothetical protein
MIDGLASFLNITTKTAIPAAVASALEASEKRNRGWNYEPPPQIRAEMELGRMVWDVRLAMEPTIDGSFGWKAPVGDLIRLLPDLCARFVDIEVKADGTVELPGLKLGVLPVVDDRMKESVVMLWDEFRKGVRLAMGLPERP